jgi:hypothetical protein
MEPGLCNITIKKGDTLDITVVWKDEEGVLVNLDEYTIIAQARPSADSDELIFYLSTEDDSEDITGSIEVSTEVDGTMYLHLDADVTAAITHRNGVWDLVTISPALAEKTLLEGRVIISDRVSKLSTE